MCVCVCVCVREREEANLRVDINIRDVLVFAYDRNVCYDVDWRDVTSDDA